MKKLLLLFVFFLLIPAILFAGTTGKIKGKVVDKSSGNPLPGVNVVLTSMWFEDIEVDLATKIGATTDINGEYYILNIPPGIYTIEFRMIGYAPVKMKKVVVEPDLTKTLNIELQEQAIKGEEVEVVAEKELIKKDITATQIVNNSNEISAMPVNTVTQIMTTNTGAVVSNSGLHIRGGRSGQVSYLVDGVEVTNNWNGSRSLDVSTEAISSLTMMTGGFNAEYGNAMSGVVNIVTKDGTDSYHGKIMFDTDKLGKEGKHIWNEYNTKLNLSGPIFTNKISFIVNYEYFATNGYLNKMTNPFTKRSFDFGLYDYDNKYNAKITLRPLNSIKINVAYMGETETYKPYDQFFKPIHKHYKGHWDLQKDLYYTTITHTLSPSTFYDLKLSYLKDQRKYYFRYKDVEDYRHFMDPGSDVFISAGGGDPIPEWNSSYEFAGWRIDTVKNDNGEIVEIDTTYHCDNDWSNSVYEKYAAKFDFTTQINKYNLIKFGFVGTQYKIDYTYFGGFFQYLDIAVADPYAVDIYNPAYHSSFVDYEYEPVDFAAYIQDKIEYEDLIVNVGLRYEYRDSKGYYFPDEKNTSKWAKAKGKGYLAPRLAFSFPVTDKAVLRFAYGYFYQFPDWAFYYYKNVYHEGDPYPNVNLGVGNLWDPVIGNGNLKPQKTINYEVGVNVALTQDMALGVVAYYKDMYDIVSTKHLVITPYNYTKVYNADYGNSKGVEISLSQRYGSFFSGRLSYTFSRAEGNAAYWDTHFNEAYNESVFGIVPPKNNTTMEWDQPHTFSMNLDFRKPDDWGVNVLVRYGSGFPYTPTDARGKPIGENYSERKPWTGTVDIRANKDFKVFKNTILRLYLYGTNILNKKNINNVYSNTGLPDQTLATNVSDEMRYRHYWYDPPRHIKVGLSFIF